LAGAIHLAVDVAGITGRAGHGSAGCLAVLVATGARIASIFGGELLANGVANAKCLASGTALVFLNTSALGGGIRSSSIFVDAEHLGTTDASGVAASTGVAAVGGQECLAGAIIHAVHFACIAGRTGHEGADCLAVLVAAGARIAAVSGGVLLTYGVADAQHLATGACLVFLDLVALGWTGLKLAIVERISRNE